MKKLYPAYSIISFICFFLILTAKTQLQAQLPSDFQLSELQSGFTNATSISFAPDGRIFVLDRFGEIFIYKPDLLTMVSAGTVPVFHQFEDGLLAMAFDPNFSSNNYIYVYYSAISPAVNRVSRFTMNADAINLGSEVNLLEWSVQRTNSYHAGGDMGFDSQGNLYISTGDNTNHGSYGALDESNPDNSAEKSSGNANDYRGKILRIVPQANGTYTIPANNLFPVGTPDTKPEIYVMGARNPYRMFIDKTNDWIFWGEVGPDANYNDPQNPTGPNNVLGPEGLDEINLTKVAGNFGWPHFSGVDNDAYQVNYAPTPYYNNPASPQNISTWNTGVTNLPAAQPALLEFFHKSHFAGPRYSYDNGLTNQQRLPVEFDGIFFYYDFNTSKVWAAQLDAQGGIVSTEQLAPSVFPTSSSDGYIDMEIGPDGHLYILEYGVGCCNNGDGSGRLVRVDYTGILTNSPPVVEATADVTDGQLPLTVNFSSAGTMDPDGDSPLSYAWDFDTDGNVDSTLENPSHIYTTEGVFSAQLKVDDGNGGIGVKNITIYAGNTKADFTFNSPPDGGLIGWGDDIAINVDVMDAEDGDTSPGGGIDCNNVSIVPSLGHLGHFHDGATLSGCPQNLTLEYDGHDIDGEMDLFYRLGTSYTDQGGLVSFDQIQIHPKRKEAEFFDEQSGVEVIANSDQLEGGSESIQVDNDSYIVFEGRNLINIGAVKYRVASANAGGSIELRVGSTTGALLATTSVINTGAIDTWANVETTFTDPGGKNDLYFVFKNTANPQNSFNVNYVEFIGAGVSIDNSPPLVNTAEVTTPTQVTIEFSEYVTKVTAEQTANYVIDNGISVTSAVLQSDNRTLVLTIDPLSSNVTYDLTISNVQNNAGLAIVSGSYPISTVNSVRVNAGGPQTIAGGQIFNADQFSVGGTPFEATIPIANTNDDALYQTERFGSHSYEIPVPAAGDYDIRLHFAELYFGVGSQPGGPGSRVFNVTIEGNPVLTQFDILSEVDPATALQKEIDNITINDGFASITFSSVTQNPKVSGIEILPPDTFNGSNNDPSISITSPSNGWDVNEPFEVAFQVENWTILEGDTHIHYFIDDVMMPPYYSYEPIPVEGIGLGSHTVRIELFNADHTPTGIFDEVAVNITGAITCNETPFPDSWVVHQLEANPYTVVYTFADDDLDGDGLKDIVTGGWWYKNPGSASGNWVKNTIGGTFGNVAHVYDFDGDGDMDLLGTTGTYTNAILVWAQNDGAGNFTVFTNIPAGDTNYSEPFLAGLAGGVYSVGGPYQMAINWNGAESTGSPVQMLTPTADPTTGTWSLVDISSDSSGEDIQAGDIDQDGDLDLFQGVNWLRNNGGGTFETFSTGITYNSTPDRAQLADFDRDGDLDAVVGQLSLNGTGNQKEFSWFAAPADPTQPWVRNILDEDIDGSLSVFAVDFDFDGDKDIVVGEWRGAQRLIVFDNDLCGSGEFELRTIDDGGLNLEHHDGARVTDIDNDGDLDVISNGWLNDMIPRIYENTTAQPSDSEPIVDAGSDQSILPLSVLTLNGSGSDPDGGVVTYQWSQESGPNTAILTGDTTATLTANDLVEGVYVFRLTVTDDESDTGFDEVTVTVSSQANVLRINSGGPDFTFDGNSWSADQNFNGGEIFTTTEPIANTTNDQLYQTERYRTNGSLIYELPVANGEHSINLHFAEIYYGLPGEGASGGAGSRVFNIDVEGEQIENYDIFVAAGGPATAVVESFTVNVADESLTIVLTPIAEFPKISGIEILTPTVPGAPTANAGDDQTVTLPTNNTVITGSATDPDGGAITYQWTQDSGPNAATLNGADTAELSVSDLFEGVYVFRLTVTDDEPTSAFDQVTVTVVPAGGVLAVVDAAPTSGSSPLDVSFTGSNSVGDISGYLWDFKDGNTSTDADPANTFTADGIYEVELTVTDAAGMTNSSTITITVGTGDGLQAIAEATPTTGEAPLIVSFTGDMSTGDIASYLWDFKDGNTSTEANPSHTFNASGTYEVDLTVMDVGGMTSSTTITIIVSQMDSGEKMGVILEKNPSVGGIAIIRVMNQPSDFMMLGINLHDSQGRLLGSFKPDEVMVVGDTYQIPVYTLRDGLYFLNIAMNQGKPISLKLMVKN